MIALRAAAAQPLGLRGRLAHALRTAEYVLLTLPLLTLQLGPGANEGIPRTATRE